MRQIANNYSNIANLVRAYVYSISESIGFLAYSSNIARIYTANFSANTKGSGGTVNYVRLNKVC